MVEGCRSPARSQVVQASSSVAQHGGMGFMVRVNVGAEFKL
jgi:hypothetical protein